MVCPSRAWVAPLHLCGKPRTSWDRLTGLLPCAKSRLVIMLPTCSWKFLLSTQLSACLFKGKFQFFSIRTEVLACTSKHFLLVAYSRLRYLQTSSFGPRPAAVGPLSLQLSYWMYRCFQMCRPKLVKKAQLAKQKLRFSFSPDSAQLV